LIKICYHGLCDEKILFVGVTVSHYSTVEVDEVFLCDMVAPTRAMNKNISKIKESMPCSL